MIILAVMEPQEQRTISIVFSRMPPGLQESDYLAWYESHLDELLAIPGVETAQLFRVTPEVVDERSPAAYSHVALFSFAGEPAAFSAGKERAGLTTKESYVALKEANGEGPALPEWWDEVRFASWLCVPVAARPQV
jgi:hypothetical protein